MTQAAITQFEDLPDTTSTSQEDDSIFSVTDLSLILKKYVEQGFAKVKIKGEISGFKKHGSGHSYFAIKDESSVLDAIAWRGSPFTVVPQDGLEVIATGRITTYPGRSKYQMIVEKLQAAGQGALMTLFLERKERLLKEGVFNQNRPLPAFPKRIGVITSPTGAVIRDILHRLEDRFPVHVLVWPTLVQGPGSADQITAAIQGFNKLSDDMKPDVLMIARGGGSLEDLWSFNEENVVRAVFESRIPTISAVGHETDTTLCDFAADMRAPTPTAAAELATPVRSQLLTAIDGTHQRMHHHFITMLRFKWTTLQGLARMITHPNTILENMMQRLDDYTDRLQRASDNFFLQQEHKLIMLKIIHPGELLHKREQQFQYILQQFQALSAQWYQQRVHSVSLLATRLAQSSYTKILDKGFSFVESDGKLIQDAKTFPTTTTKVTLNFKDGQVIITPQTITKIR